MSESMIFQLAGTISKITTMSRNTIRLQLDSQENISPEAMKRAFEWHDKLGWFLFAIRQLEPEDILDLPKFKPTDAPKTKSQTQRAIIYRMWEQDNEGYKDSEFHYNYWMDKIAIWLKERLE